jgi:hypothetical protein
MAYTPGGVTQTQTPSQLNTGAPAAPPGAPPAVPNPNGPLNSQDAGSSAQAGADQAKLVQDPVTGMWMDPSNRAVFQLVNGQYIPVHDLNMSGQVARNIALSSSYGGLGKDYDASLRATMGEQHSLADSYRQTISDPNAASVAREQLGQALSAADATQASQASGVSGENAFLGRRNASNNMAGLAAQAGQSSALVRAGEVANAQTGLGNTLGAMGNEAGGAIANYSGLGATYAGLAGGQGTAGNANATAVRGQNIGIAKDVAAGASGALAPVTGGASLAFTPPAGPDDIAHLST